MREVKRQTQINGENKEAGRDKVRGLSVIYKYTGIKRYRYRGISKDTMIKHRDIDVEA